MRRSVAIFQFAPVSPGLRHELLLLNEPASGLELFFCEIGPFPASTGKHFIRHKNPKYMCILPLSSPATGGNKYKNAVLVDSCGAILTELAQFQNMDDAGLAPGRWFGARQAVLVHPAQWQAISSRATLATSVNERARQSGSRMGCR